MSTDRLVTRRSSAAQGPHSEYDRLHDGHANPTGSDRAAAVSSADAGNLLDLPAAADTIVLADNHLYAFSKRLLDIIFSLIFLFLFSPVMLLIALLVKLDSPGPAIFSHYRVGRGLRLFRFYKFRTMRVDARDAHPDLYAYKFDPDKLDRVFLQVRGDPRVTRLGRLLRRTSLDELPNFWNVLAGDMSLVGPRPEVPQMLPYYSSKTKFGVLPGVTGLAQISGRGKLCFLDTVRFDENYIRRRSFWYDVQILVRTGMAVFTQNYTVGH